MNSFLGLNTAVKGLYVSQASIYTTSHNISNADTDGYSRQVSSQIASKALSTGSGMIGTGVDYIKALRVRDEFLDSRYWKENVSYGEWNVKSQALKELESLMNETSEDGLNDVLSEFSSVLDELAKEPESDETRAVVLETAQTLCRYINNMADNLASLQRDYNTNVKVKVNEVNSYTEQIRDLNEQIYKAELNGSTANDLRDQRALLVDKLTSIADVTVNEYEIGTLPNGEADVRFQIIMDGVSLVNHFTVNELECYTINNGSDNDGMYGIRWTKTGIEAEFEGGEIKGYIDLRDGTGENGEYKGIPYYMKQLDEFAGTFAKAFNEGIYADGSKYCEGHSGGAGLDGTTGTRFFSFNGISSKELMDSGTNMDEIYNSITASNISITSDIENDAALIAAASISGESGNNENITGLVAIFSDSGVFSSGTPEDFVNSVISTMGVSASHASRMYSNYENITNQINTKRTSVSGVSLDEETANLVLYQQTYNAASKIISVLDEILDMTINGLGVG